MHPRIDVVPSFASSGTNAGHQGWKGIAPPGVFRTTPARNRRARLSIVPGGGAASAPGRDPARWARFVSLAEDAGLSEERLLAAFPDPEDVEDILATPDEALGACARTMAAALGSRSVTGPERRSAVLEPVRCIDCRHFVRSTSHPRLGRCGGGEPAHAAGGWWDTQFRACESFARSAPTDVAQSTYGYSSGR